MVTNQNKKIKLDSLDTIFQLQGKILQSLYHRRDLTFGEAYLACHPQEVGGWASHDTSCDITAQSDGHTAIHIQTFLFLPQHFSFKAGNDFGSNKEDN